MFLFHFKIFEAAFTVTWMYSKLMMYCIDRAGVPKSHDAHVFCCLYTQKVKLYGLPPLNINTKALVSMQYILNISWLGTTDLVNNNTFESQSAYYPNRWFWVLRIILSIVQLWKRAVHPMGLDPTLNVFLLEVFPSCVQLFSVYSLVGCWRSFWIWGQSQRPRVMCRTGWNQWAFPAWY